MFVAMAMAGKLSTDLINVAIMTVNFNVIDEPCEFFDGPVGCLTMAQIWNTVLFFLACLGGILNHKRR